MWYPFTGRGSAVFNGCPLLALTLRGGEWTLSFRDPPVSGYVVLSDRGIMKRSSIRGPAKGRFRAEALLTVLTNFFILCS